MLTVWLEPGFNCTEKPGIVVYVGNHRESQINSGKSDSPV